MIPACVVLSSKTSRELASLVRICVASFVLVCMVVCCQFLRENYPPGHKSVVVVLPVQVTFQLSPLSIESPLGFELVLTFDVIDPSFPFIYIIV